MRPADVTKLLLKLCVGLVVLLALIGCSGRTVPTKEPAVDTPEPEPTAAATIKFHADVDFTTAEREYLLLAASQWSVQTEGLADIQLVFDADFYSESWFEAHKEDHMLGRFVSTQQLVVDHDAEGNGNLLGRVSPSGGIHNPWHRSVQMLLVADRLETKADWLGVAIHEFGHALGVPHVSAIQSVMFPYHIAHKHSCLKKPDLAAFCQVNECGTKKMHPCE